MQAGYSRRPLAAKLGIKSGMRLMLIHAPAGYQEMLAPLPEPLTRVSNVADGVLDFIQYFATERAALDADFDIVKAALRPEGMLWVSWPKRTSKDFSGKVPTDLDENIVRTIGLEHGLVDVKVAAIDLTWSGLKFVYRLSDRTG
jgi:hypothetical protein